MGLKIQYLQATLCVVSRISKSLRSGLGLFVAVQVISLSASAAENLPRVLVLHSYHQGMQWTDSVTAGLQARLQGKAELVIEYLDVKRFPEQAHVAEIESRVDACVARVHPQVIVPVDDFAYQFVRSRRLSWSKLLPVVFGGVNFHAGAREPLVTGVVEAINVAGTLELAFGVFPRSHRIVVVNDRTETGRANEEVLRDALRSVPLGARGVNFLGEGTFEETEQALAALDANGDLVLLLSWNLDSKGATRSYDEAVARAREVCKAPLLGVWDFYAGKGILGGELLGGRTHGEELGGLVLQVLGGRMPEDIPIVTQCRTQPTFDYNELERFGISHRTLDPRIQIINVPEEPWRDYGWLIGGVCVVIVLQGLSIAWLTVSLRRRRIAEQHLQDSREQLRRTLDSSSDAILATDATGRVVLANPVAATLLDRAASACLGEQIDSLLHLKQVDNEQDLFPVLSVSVMRDLRTYSATSSLLVTQTGSKRLVSFSAAPMRGTGGQVAGMVAAIRDISKQRQLEEQLRQSQKLESIGLLAGGIAHDFNNILLVIEGNVTLLEQEGGLDQEKLQSVEEIRGAAKRAGELTRQLLAYGRKQKLRMDTVDLAALVQGILKMVRRLIGANIQLNCEVELGRHWVHVDAGQIEQVVLNLCLNARDAMTRGGVIQVELRHTSFSEEDAHMQLGLQAGDFVELIVSDNGMGMSRETVSRIFEPFFSTKAVGSGTGLGLAVVQGIVQQHKGVIHVWSQLGVGSSFHVYLPASSRREADGEAGLSAGSQDAKPQQEGESMLVLLADDDSGVRKAIGRILERHGFEVLYACDGDDACRVSDACEREIDVAVLDVVMPRMSGPEAAMLISAKRPDLPFVLCSGFPGMLRDTFELKPNWRWLVKPYPKDELIRTIQELIAQRKGRVGTRREPAA